MALLPRYLANPMAVSGEAHRRCDRDWFFSLSVGASAILSCAPGREVMGLLRMRARSRPGGGANASGGRSRSHPGRDASREECQGPFRDAPANGATRIARRMHQPQLTPPATLNQAPQVRRELDRELLRLLLQPARGTLLLAPSVRGEVLLLSEVGPSFPSSPSPAANRRDRAALVAHRRARAAPASPLHERSAAASIDAKQEVHQREPRPGVFSSRPSSIGERGGCSAQGPACRHRRARL
jgi:hypothetical protein